MFKVVRCLLSCGADGNVCGGVKDRPLHLAASRGLSAITSLLLEAGADRMFTTLRCSLQNISCCLFAVLALFLSSRTL